MGDARRYSRNSGGPARGFPAHRRAGRDRVRTMALAPGTALRSATGSGAAVRGTTIGPLLPHPIAVTPHSSVTAMTNFQLPISNRRRGAQPFLWDGARCAPTTIGH